MEDQQKSTNINKKQHFYDSLELKYQQAVDLNLEGASHKVIAKMLQVKEQTVRTWFMKGGLCYPAHKEKEKQRRQEWQKRFAEIDDKLKEMAVDAVLTIKQNLNKGSLWAAFGVLDRVGFQPVTKIQPITEPKVNIINYVYPKQETPKIEDGETEEDTTLQPWRPDEEALATNNT